MKDNIEKYWENMETWKLTGTYWNILGRHCWNMGSTFWEHIRKLFGSYGNYGNILGTCSQNIEGIFGTYGKKQWHTMKGTRWWLQNVKLSDVCYPIYLYSTIIYYNHWKHNSWPTVVVSTALEICKIHGCNFRRLCISAASPQF